MNRRVWAWLLLALVPGCLLVQPLDEATSDDAAGASGGNGNASAGTGSAGRPTSAGGGAPSAGAPSGGSHAGGAAQGGAPSGVDFSLFIGTWTITSGSTTRDCGTDAPTTEPATVGAQDSFGLGTTSDLILDPGTQCALLVDVDDRVASSEAAQECTFQSEGYTVHVYVDSFEFTVSGDGKTAISRFISTVDVSDGSGASATCDTDQTLHYKR